jgi:hypothetical protein
VGSLYNIEIQTTVLDPYQSNKRTKFAKRFLPVYAIRLLVEEVDHTVKDGRTKSE